MQYKVVDLSDDPWSEELEQKISCSPHYKTALQWKNNKNIALNETEYYVWLKAQLDAEGTVWNGILNNKEDIIRQCEKFKHLFEIAPNFTDEPIQNRLVDGRNHYFGPICVKIADNGEIDIWDGMHRISILLALDYPVKLTICERHQHWQNIINDLRNLYSAAIYQAIPHPDFADWQSCDNSVKESHITDVVITHNIKSVLDLGSCHGHVLYNLRKLLESAVGVEYDPVRYRVLKLVFDKLCFKSHNADMYDITCWPDQHFDCVFALAVFHHFARQNPIEKFNDLLDHISDISDMLLYELPEPDEEQYKWMYQEINMHELIQSRYKNKIIIPMQKRKLVLLNKI